MRAPPLLLLFPPLLPLPRRAAAQHGATDWCAHLPYAGATQHELAQRADLATLLRGKTLAAAALREPPWVDLDMSVTGNVCQPLNPTSWCSLSTSMQAVTAGPGGQLTGLDIDLMRLIALEGQFNVAYHYEGIPVGHTWTDTLVGSLSFQGLLERYDIVAGGGWLDTPYRRNLGADFTVSLYDMGSALAVKKSEKDKYTNVDDFMRKRKQVCLPEGWGANDPVIEQWPGLQYQTAPANELTSLVLAGEVCQGMIMPMGYLKIMLKGGPPVVEGETSGCELAIVGDASEIALDGAFPMRSRRADLCEWFPIQVVNAAIQRLRARGQLQAVDQYVSTLSCPPPSPAASAGGGEEDSDDDDSNQKAVIAGVVAVAIAVFCLLIIVALICRNRGKAQGNAAKQAQPPLLQNQQASPQAPQQQPPQPQQTRTQVQPPPGAWDPGPVQLQSVHSGPGRVSSVQSTHPPPSNGVAAGSISPPRRGRGGGPPMAPQYAGEQQW